MMRGHGMLYIRRWHIAISTTDRVFPQ